MSMPMATLDQIEALAAQWLDIDINPSTRSEIHHLLLSKNYPELQERLSSRISFGTAGLRSAMKAGFAHMNDITVLQASQGLVKYLQPKANRQSSPSIVVGYDHRYHSQRFAEITASAALLQGFTVYYLGSVTTLSQDSVSLSSSLGFEPASDTKSGIVHTPLVPFCVDQYGAEGGVMITASHNPANDNGYKVYYGNGCQIIPPHDDGIATSIDDNLHPWDGVWDVAGLFSKGLNQGKLIAVHDEAQSEYLKKLETLIVCKAINFSFVYTPIHGVGQEIFDKTYLLFEPHGPLMAYSVELQKQPNPDFPTVSFPNPEEKGALDLAIKEADTNNVSLVVLNDPDADRFSVAVKLKKNGKWKQLTGNEIGFLFAMWTIEKYKGDISKVYLVNSTVSSQILKAMAEHHGFHYVDTLTGFKWIGNKTILLREGGWVVPFGYEEAIGYMFNLVNDKDGLAAMVEWLQMYEKWFVNGSLDPIGKLIEGYELYGWYKECNGYFKLSDLLATVTIFNFIRTEYAKDGDGVFPNKIGDLEVDSWRDLTIGFDSSTKDNKPTLHVDANSQMITVEGRLLDETVRFTCRGSGTEPKLKVYIEARAGNEEKADEVARRCWDILKTEWFKPEKYGLTEVV